MEAKIDNFQGWLNSANEQQLCRDIEQMLHTAGFTLLNFVEHHFEPQGYTALWLLAESHCALHTFPEENRSYVELSSCNGDLYVLFVRAFNEYRKQLHGD